MKIKSKIILSLLAFAVILVTSFFIGYKFPHNKNPQLIPECTFGRCPEYQSLDVNGDGQSESVAVVPTAMTKGAGKVWVIDNGKVIFISPEYAGVGVKWLETNNGFIMSHQELLPSGDLGPVINQKYVYKDGAFIPETL